MAKGKEKRSWYSMKALASGAAEIAIYSEIGDWGVTASDFKRDLDALGTPETLNLRLMSPGGEVSQGFAIFNMLNRHAARKIVTIDGLAASMASVIAMVGDEIEMPSNALMMIHNPTGVAWGDAEQIDSYNSALRKMQDQIVDAYVKRSGADREEIIALMDRETWLTAQEAVELGLADRVSDAVEMTASLDISKFHKVPAAFRRKMESLMSNKSKTARNASKDAASESESDSVDPNASLKASDEIREEIKAQNKEIRSICALAGKPELADGFIDDDLSPSDVIAKIEALVAKDKKGDLATRNNPNTHRDSGKTLDPVKAYQTWNNPKKKVA